MPEIYLDHNATTPLAPEALEAMLPWLREPQGNPSAKHRLGRAARAAIDQARRTVADLLGCATDEVVFTSSGSESNNLAIKGAALAARERGRHVLYGASEHPSVALAARSLEPLGFEVEAIPADATGQIHPMALARKLRPDTVVVSIMTAQNVVGTINRLEELAEVLVGHPAILHTDAVQAVGKIPTSFPFLGADLMSLAGHKFYGPRGTGALIVKRGRRLESLVHGAGHESGRRAGTEDTAGIVGLARALEVALRTMASSGELQVALRDALHARLAEALPGVVLNGHPLDRLPNTLNLSFLGVNNAALAERVPDLLVATGPACHDRSAEVSPTFCSMGLEADRAGSSLRIALGRHTTLAEIEHVAEQLTTAVRALRAEGGSSAAASSEVGEEPSQGPRCPRCETSALKITEIQSFPAVVCELAPECRYEAFLVPPPGVAG